MEEETREKYIICVDPESHHVYSLNPETEMLHIESDVPEWYRIKSEQAIQDLHYIINLNSDKWLYFSKQANRYRRRKIPSYLLIYNYTKYPRYICQSPLSLAFASKQNILLEIHLSDYIQQFRQNQITFSDPYPILSMTVGLVTSANEVIKNIIRQIYQKWGLKLSLEKEGNSTFILQVKGYREYIIGSEPMLAFDRVRIVLRGHALFSVLLTEADLEKDRESDFPPTIYRNIEDTQKGKFDPIQWQLFRQVPILMWYPPHNLPIFDQFNVNCYIDEFDKKQKVLKLFSSYSNNLTQKNKQLKFRVAIKENIEEIVNKKKEQYKKQIFPLKNFTLLSGECDFPFQIVIRGIENLFQIFKQSLDDLPDSERATFNGILPPRYIQKNFEFKKAREYGEKITRNFKEIGNLCEALKFNFPKKVLPKDISIEELFYNKLQINHGVFGSNLVQSVSMLYDLDIVPYLISIQVSILVGNIVIGESIETKKIPFQSLPRWNQKFTWKKIDVSLLPIEARLCFNIIAYSNTGLESQVIGSTSMQIFDEDAKFNSGLRALNIWPFYSIEERLVCQGQYWGVVQECFSKNKKPSLNSLNYDELLKKFISKEYARLTIQLDSFNEEMYWSLRDHKTQVILDLAQPLKKNEDIYKCVPNTQAISEALLLLQRDPLNRKFTLKENFNLKICRDHYKSIPEALEIFLCSIDYLKPEDLRETYNMIYKWHFPSPEQCLPLLDVHFPDESIRLHAVEKISKLSDDEIQLYMIELTQCLLFENLHYSPLCELLLEKALNNPHVILHDLFWSLRSQLHLKPSFERFSLIVEQLIMLSGEYRQELVNEVKVNYKLMEVARHIKNIKDQKDIEKKRLHDSIKLLKEARSKFPKCDDGGGFILAIDNRQLGNDFVADKIKVMNSKKLPIWMVIENSNKHCENQRIEVMFKDGDDIRQDYLTLQLIRIMDKIWLDAGYDFRMRPYKVMSTQDMVGMIEIVLNSYTTAGIHKKYGGTLGAIKDNTIYQFLREEQKNEEQFMMAKENFIHSCAGYCVATYILGIGDRHSDNIMLSRTGHLFHIDFGHFLGNFKKKYGFEREKAKFVFTEEMAFVMGGTKAEAFHQFEELCSEAYNQIRKHGFFLINIFRLMLSAGLPELQQESDISYLVDMLSLNLSDVEASSKFKREIRDSLNAQSRRIDNLIHELKRG